MTLTSQQQEAYDALQRFLADDDTSVFILKGYAGTGKTALINALLPSICERGKHPRLMAPTGRAAQILGNKCELRASTIHGAIYSTEKVVAKFHDKDGNLTDAETGSEADKNSRGVDDIQFYYAIKNEHDYDPSKVVIIVDEASMVCSTKAENDRFHFGSDILLEDLLTYAKPRGGAKLIFVGDPVQLPPVGDNKSAALTTEYFIAKGLGATEYTLTDVVRQKADSAILKNAMMVRDLYEAEIRNNLVFDIKESETEALGKDDVVEKVIKRQPTPAIGSTIVICYKNSDAQAYNDAIRRRYFPGNTGLMVGDVLMVVHNNYFHDTSLFNGDFVKVLAIKGTTTHKAPVWIEEGGNRKRILIDINYIKVDVETSTGEKLEYQLLQDLLESDKPSISGNMEKAMYVDLKMRYEERAKLNPRQELSGFTTEDPFYNALRVKYGYAITCHKAQGGEWDTAIVDYANRTGLNDDCLRWNYTATTRAAKMLYAVNMPRVTPLDKFAFNTTATVRNLPEEALAIKDSCCLLLPDNAEPFRKAKCNGIQAALKDIGGTIENVKPLHYCDRYEISIASNKVIIDCRYTKSGAFTGCKVINGTEFAAKVLEICNSANKAEYEYDYEPPFTALEQIHENMKSICDDHAVEITNIVHHPQAYDVIYYLSTPEGLAYIKFFYNGNRMLTRAMPHSLSDDNKTLESIIEKLSLCVSSK